jgi:hypothetical protein
MSSVYLPMAWRGGLEVGVYCKTIKMVSKSWCQIGGIVWWLEMLQLSGAEPDALVLRLLMTRTGSGLFLAGEQLAKAEQWFPVSSNR